MTSLAIVIASKNRPADIARAIRSIRSQATQPDRIIVVDQSDRPYDLPPQSGLVHHYDPTIAGLTSARNVGIALNDCDIVLFIDDDIELASDVVAQVRDALLARTGTIGVQCEILPVPRPAGAAPPGLGARLWGAWQTVFWRGFFAYDWVPIRGTDELKRLQGGGMAFWASLFRYERFDANLAGYGFGEDWDFSRRARRHGRFHLVRGAKLVHHESPANRHGQRRLLEQRWRNVRYFYEKFSDERGPADAFWLRWWMLGETLIWLRKGYGVPWRPRP